MSLHVDWWIMSQCTRRRALFASGVLAFLILSSRAGHGSDGGGRAQEARAARFSVGVVVLPSCRIHTDLPPLQDGRADVRFSCSNAVTNVSVSVDGGQLSGDVAASARLGAGGSRAAPRSSGIVPGSAGIVPVESLNRDANGHLRLSLHF